MPIAQLMRARREDEPHLLLCEAVFTLQSDRGPEFHFHLEQPIGSEMLYQDSLQTFADDCSQHLSDPM